MSFSRNSIFGLVFVASMNCSLAFSAESSEQNDEPKKGQANSQQQTSSNSSATKIQETVLGMNVSGNKELPNVLYIVPWKGDATPAPLPQVTRLVDEIYSPVEPEVFNKQVKFFYQLTKQNADTKDTQE